PKDKPDDLVTRLQSETDQVRAQVFDLVQHDELKWAIIRAYPAVYLSMEEAPKGQILRAMSLANVLQQFINVAGFHNSPESFATEVLFPLAAISETDLLQDLFSQCQQNEQRAMLISYKWQLLRHLGATAEYLTKQDWTIFSYYPPIAQAKLLNRMTAQE